MFTTRISPKMSVKPLATTKYSAAAVSPFSSVMKKSLGSSIADPKLVPDAMNRTQMTGKTTSASSSQRPTRRSDPYVAISSTRRDRNSRPIHGASRTIENRFWRPSDTSGALRRAIERRPQGLLALGALVGQRPDRRHDRPVDGACVGPVDLHEVARGIAEVHLQRAVVELAHVRLAAVEQPALARLAIRRLEVVDVEADVVEVRRGHVALEDVQLHISGLEPLDLHVWEVGAGDAPHGEHLGVEAHRLLQIAGVDADVGEAGRAHAPDLTSRPR